MAAVKFLSDLSEKKLGSMTKQPNKHDEEKPAGLA